MRSPYQIKTLLPLANTGKDLLDILQTAKITRQPLDLRVLTAFFLDFVDGVGPLFFLAVDHDYTRTVLDEGTGDLEANTEGAASDERDAAIEVVDLLFGPNDRVEDRLHLRYGLLQNFGCRSMRPT